VARCDCEAREALEIRERVTRLTPRGLSIHAVAVGSHTFVVVCPQARAGRAVFFLPDASDLHTLGAVRSYAEMDADVPKMQPQIPAQRNRPGDDRAGVSRPLSNRAST
jgi:hypothetical protein